MKLEAYLFFPGNTEEAMTFYQGIFGGELSITRRGDVDPTAAESEKDLVINAALDSGAFTLRASDRSDATSDVQTRIELTVNGSDEDDLRRIFDALSEGGTVKARWRRCSGATSSALSSTGSDRVAGQHLGRLKRGRRTIEPDEDFTLRGTHSIRKLHLGRSRARVVLPSIEKKYGRSIAEWQKIIAGCGLDNTWRSSGTSSPSTRWDTVTRMRSSDGRLPATPPPRRSPPPADGRPCVEPERRFELLTCALRGRAADPAGSPSVLRGPNGSSSGGYSIRS